MKITSFFKTVSILLFVSFLGLSCEESIREELNIERVSMEYPYYEGDSEFSYFLDTELKPASSIGYMKSTKIGSGESTVFQYKFTHDDVEIIADDEYSETITFQVPSNINSFSYDTPYFEDLGLVLSQYCFCYYGDPDNTKDVAPTGTIEGIKLGDNLWYIQMDLVFYGDEERTLSDVFELSTLD